MLLNLFVTSLVMSVIAYAPLRDMLRNPATSKVNFRRDYIAGSAGLLIPISFLGTLAVLTLEGGKVPLSWLLFIFYVFAVCLLGFMDDVLGDRQVTGIRGHFRLLARGRFTSGALKAIGGGAAAVVVADAYSASIPELVLNICMLGLMLNFFNSLDLRPGRSIKVFLICAAATVIATFDQGGLDIWALALPPILVLLWADLSLQSMLGDAGSNVLGAVLGYVLVANLNWIANLVILGVLVLFHVYTEKRSLSELIFRVGFLRKFDELGTKRR